MYPAPGDLKRSEAGDGVDGEGGDNLLGDFAGRFAQGAGQLEGERQGVIAELALRGLLDLQDGGEGGGVELRVEFEQPGVKALAQKALLGQIHRSVTGDVAGFFL